MIRVFPLPRKSPAHLGATNGLVFTRTFFGGFFKKSSQEKPKSSNMVENDFGKYDIVQPCFVSKMREVPDYIPKPSYARTSFLKQRGIAPKNEIEIKNQNQVDCMRRSCGLAKNILKQAGYLVQPGVTTEELDEKIHEMILGNAAYPSPLNYFGFPKSICTSINNVACHGIPDDRPLRRGDIINVDITVYHNGFHGDCSAMFTVEETDEEAKRLINTTELCLMKAIEICKPNEDFCNIGNLIEEIANKNGYNVLPAFCGHGIGSSFHEPPDIYHFANSVEGKMQPGMTFTIEPILTQGGKEVEVLEDGWTAVTVDHARTAQVEHTILINDHGCEILTR